MIDFSSIQLKNIIVHKVGNKATEEGIRFSENPLKIDDETILELLMKYLFSPFNSNTYYRLHHEIDLNLNEIYVFISKIFEDDSQFIEQSKNISKHLYDKSSHPKIKGGEFYIAYIKDCVLDGEMYDAIGLFKTENKDTYLRILEKDDSFEVDYDTGININKLDKGCLIFNCEKEKGYLVSIIDNINKSAEARYWKEDFLKIKPREDNFYFTQNCLKMCKDFTNESFEEISKDEQIEIKNNALKYFSEKDTFSLDDFADSVIANPETKEIFKEYKQSFEEDNNVQLQDKFEISQPAISKSKSFFKTVVKLDKNFHLYIHGGNENIEKGFDDEKNMSYYKLYYESEK
jgi:hypothetical protein